MVLRVPRVGDRVRVVDNHRWKPGRVGRIVEIHDRVGARYVVKFDRPELGFYTEGDSWHVEVGLVKPPTKRVKPMLLRLTERDLEVYPEDE